MLYHVDEDGHLELELAARIVLLLSRGQTLPIRPMTEDTPWVRTAWPKEQFL